MTIQSVALIYCRVSRLDEEERERKLSPDMQREKALGLPELRGLTVEQFEDLDLSGKDTSHRPQYLAMMRRLEDGGVRHVVAYDLSRITRSVGDQAVFFAALRRNGALFLESATGRVSDPNDEDDELGANVLGSVNQHYRQKTARRIRDSLATKVARGELVGPPPAGYMRRKEVLPSGKVARTWIELDPERAPVIKTVFAEYATGKWSFKSLARELNSRRLPLPRAPHFHNNRARAELWTADVLKDLLNNPRYAGRVPRRDGQTFAGNYPAIVDEATWAACEQVRANGKRSHLATASAAMRPPRYALSGLLKCGSCGSSMSGWTRAADRSHLERYSYMCYLRRVAQGCDAPSVAQDEIEGDVRAILETVALPDGLAEAVDAAVAAQEGARGKTQRKATLASVDNRLARLRDLYELGDLTKVDYLSRREALQAERESLTAPAVPSFVRQRTTLRSLCDGWDEMDADHRKRILASVFETITVGADGVKELTPREGWRPYVLAAIRTTRTLPERATLRVHPERKTGLEPATLTLAR